MSLQEKMQQKKQMQDNNRKVLVHGTVETYIDSVNNSRSVGEQDRFTVEGEMGKELQKIAEEYFKRDHALETQLIINRYLNEERSLYKLPFFWGFKTFPGLQNLFRPVWHEIYWPLLKQ
jgi:hemerythrin-like domain-containing protein